MIKHLGKQSDPPGATKITALTHSHLVCNDSFLMEMAAASRVKSTAPHVHSLANEAVAQSFPGLIVAGQR